MPPADAAQTVAALGEFALIDRLAAALAEVGSAAAPDLLGIGDDAAIWTPTPGTRAVITTDSLIEGIHFRLDWTGWGDLGHKALAVNLSDIAAMGASPRAAIVTLSLSPDVEAPWVIELYAGMREACDEHALWLVGGDLTRGAQIAISVTVAGDVAPGRGVTRAGARPGDVVAVTGELGASAAGLRIARAGRVGGERDRALLLAHLRPTARVGEGAVLARRGATAMMDVSDGLAKDLARLASASDVGVRLRLAEVPVADGADPGEALAGGEDYELVVTLPGPDILEAAAAELRASFGTALTAIGDVVAGAGLVAIEDDASERPLEAAGWDHFR
jgi:thiamine-monophosphate kinase